MMQAMLLAKQAGIKMMCYITGQEPKKVQAIVELMLNHSILGEVLLFAIEELLLLNMLC